MKLGIPKIYKSLNELFDRFKFQLYVLCIWKNIQIYKKNKVGLCIEILWPLLFVGIVVLMRYNYGDRAYLRQDECHFYSKPLLSAGFFEFLHGYICHFNNTCHQEYVENDNFFANQTSQLSAAFLEINKFMEEDKNATENILIQFLAQLGQYDSLKNNNKQTDKTYQRKELQGVADEFNMDNFINLHQYFLRILRLPKVRRVMRHFRPLLNQFEDWISGNPTLYDDDIIAIIGGMKLICGPKFYLDNEHVEKINVEAFFKELLLKPFKIESRDMKSEFCQNIDKKIKEIPMLNKIWITIKPMFIGKLLFTPRNAATWKILQNINSTFERFAFYHKFTRDFINFLNVAFQKIKDIQGKEAFEKHKIDILSFTRHLEMAYKISSKISEALDCLNVDRIEGFSTESELVEYARHYIDRNTFFAGVVFLDMEDNKRESSMDNLTTMLNFVRYKIRMDSQKIDPTDSLFDDDEPYSPRRHPLTHLKYYYHGFVILQELLDTAITDVSSNNSILSESYIHKPRVTLQQIPQPCYNRDEFLRSFYWILPLQICLSWTLTIAIIILTMAEESKNHLHQFYRILGMNDTILILAQLATLLIPTFISSTLTALILFKGRILLYSDTLAIVSILFNYGMTTVCLGILIGTLFRKYSVSPYVGILLYLLITFLPYYINKAKSTIVFAQRMLWLIPSVPFVESFLNIIDLEIAQVGLQWDNIVFRQKELPMSLIDNFIILIFDSILFIGTSIMIEKAKYNFISEAYFKIWQILKQRFLQRVKKQKMDKANAIKKFIQNDLYMEKEPVNSKCSMEILNLTKTTVDGRVLDNVSLKFYENQLACLLVNSITGNALISIIMKLQQQDSGGIYIYDNKSREQIKHDNRNIGYMPTYDIMINELTVEENLWFYTKLKNSEKIIKTTDIEGILKSFHLYDVRFTPANQLSSNLIRRLCVAISFVGKGKIILLQDPFYRLDFYSKQVLYDVLADYKSGRTILMTTSDINDATIVSDKIAIINDGRLLCFGSKIFLRTIFTKGFDLKVELGHIEDIIGILRQIKFLNMPEIFESDIKNGFDTDSHITNVFLQISNHFIPNSYFVEKKGEKYKFIMPYITKDGMYDCIANNLALRRLFSLLDKCKNQLKTLRYEFNTSSINEVYQNVKAYEMQNSLRDINSFVYEELHSVKQLHKSIKLNSDSATAAQNNKVDYSILSIDPESKNLNGYQQIIKARLKRNYRNYRFALQIFLFPFLILFFTTIWTRFIQKTPAIYPAPLNILLNTDKVDIFARGYKNDVFRLSSETVVGVQTLKSLIKNDPTLNLKSLGNKCVYLMDYTNTDISGCMKSDITCYITTILNNSESAIGLGYMNIYRIILANMCKMKVTNISLKLSSQRDIYRESILHHKCFCDEKDGRSNCPVKYNRSSYIKMALYNIFDYDSISCIPTYLSSSKLILGGFDTLTQNKSIEQIKKLSSYKMQEFLLKVTKNITTVFPLKASYLKQVHYLTYLFYNPRDNMKIWFDNRWKIGMPSIISLYDIAYFRTLVSLKNVYNYEPQSYDPNNTNETKYSLLDRTSIFHNKNLGRQYIDIFEGNDYGFVAINHPIHSSSYLKTRTIIYLYITMWVQICMASFITTTILKDMFEDTRCYQHCFQLYKIKPLFNMLLNIMYTNWIYILAINVCLLVFKINIKYERFNHLYGILLYVLYGWALIPFMMTVTYLKPKCSMLSLNIINIGIGFLCILLEFTINLLEFRMTSMLILTFLIPHYGFEKALYIVIGTTFDQYEYKYFYRLEPNSEFMIKIFSTLIISGIFYYTIVCCYECNVFTRGKEIMKKNFSRLKLSKYVQSQMGKSCCKKRKQEEFTFQEKLFKGKWNENIVENKVVELERTDVEMSDPTLYPILVKKITTSKLSQISIKGENGCCLGLIGLDSGMGRFVSLLTGECKPFKGDVYIHGHNTKINEHMLQNFIGYSPKDIYLNIYLTPRESLEFYSNIKYKGSAKSKKVVEFLINHFDIKETQWIKDCLDSTKRKLLLAIALMLDPPILILAEPFIGLNMIDTSVAKKTISDMIAIGKCVIVLSNNIKDCQYYSKLSIFNDKEIKCSGSIQDLKTRYESGYMVSVKFNKNRNNKYSMKTNLLLAQRLLGTFPSSQIVEFHMSYIKIYIIDSTLQISRIFVTLEAVQNLYSIDDYSICLASLEEVLSKFSNSYEDFITENMINRNRPCDIPYVAECFEASH